MPKRGLDTSILIKHWHDKRGRRTLVQLSRETVIEWAKELQEMLDSDAIVTPVRIEMLAGTQSKIEYELTRIFLDQFTCIDNGRILPDDWQEAERLASRVPFGGQRRQLGDCIIAAVFRRLNYDPRAEDKRFPRP